MTDQTAPRSEAPRAGLTGKQKKRIWRGVQTVLILIAAFIMLIPIIWIFLAAFKSHVEVYQLRLFFTPTLENFGTVFEEPYDLGDGYGPTRASETYVCPRGFAWSASCCARRTSSRRAWTTWQKHCATARSSSC